MKRLLFFVVIIYSLCSCGIVKKGFNKSKKDIDTSQVSKEDGGNKKSADSATTKSADSTGKKTTTTTNTKQEGDSSDFEIVISYDTARKKTTVPVKPIVIVVDGDSTTVDTGNDPVKVSIKGSKKKSKAERTETATSDSSAVSKRDNVHVISNDSSGYHREDSSRTKSKENVVSENVNRWHFGIPWYVWLILIVGGFVVWKYRLWKRKKLNEGIFYSNYNPPAPPDEPGIK